MEEGKDTQELELLERVFLRLGMAESDSQLEAVLARFLPGVVLKTASTSLPVQKKVLELLNHVSKRLKSRTDVQLPVEQLLTQFTDPASSSAVVNFSVIYIKYGYPRLSPEDQVRVLPSLLQSMQIRTTQQDSVLQLCIPALVHIKWPEGINDRSSILSLSDKPDVRKILLDFLVLYLLLPYGPLDVKPGQLPPPGLNRQIITRLTGGVTPSHEQLEERKLAIVKLLSVEVLSPEEVICPLIVASGDPKSSVGEMAERFVKQFGHGLDWDDAVLIQNLMKLFLGTTATPGKRPTSSQSVEPVSSCNLRIKMKIAPFLLKSSFAANSFPNCIQVVFDGLFGSNTSPKLRILMLEFVHHICHRAVEGKLSVMAPILLTGLYKIVERPDEDNKMKAIAYTGVGMLAQRAPALFQKDPNHLLRLFKVLTESGTVDRDVGLSVQACMGLMAPAYRGVDGQPALILEAALLENIFSVVPQARLMAAVLASSSLFSFSHIPSRFVSMVACGDSHENVRETGKKGLMLPKSSEEGFTSSPPPRFPDMVKYFHRRADILLKSGDCYSTAAGKLPFSPAILIEALGFLRLCLEESAGVSEEDRFTGKTLDNVREYLLKIQPSDHSSVELYLELLLQSLGPAGDIELYSVAMVSLLQMTVAVSELIAPKILPQLSWIRGFTQSSKPSVSEPAGQLLGVLSKLLDEEEFLSLTSEVYQDTYSKTHYIQLGAVVALGHLTSTAISRMNNLDTENKEEQVKLTTTIGRAFLRFVVLLDGGRGVDHLIAPACAALGYAFHGGQIPLEERGDKEEVGEEEKGSKSKVRKIDSGLTKNGLISKLKSIFNSDKDIRTRELCAIALGRMGVYETDSTCSHTILKAMFSVREDKAVELQFTVGEAVSCVAAGSLSTALRSPWELGGRDRESVQGPKPELLTETLDILLTDHAPHPLASVRQSSCIWLLCIVKHASHHVLMKDNLKTLQHTFMNFLAETNEITQEVASRGLGLTYDLCDGSIKQEMVQSLVGTLLEGRRVEQKVTDETEVFRKGELGKAPEGKGLSTYKELCSLASDLNKPDLIYKFMHLANHHALWNSKKGAAFGFSMIAATAREELSSHLPLLVPRLYRYKYDPNPRVQLAMTSIWSAVVPESKKAVDRYLTAILDDLSQNLNSHIWRNRQASCMALGDLLVGQQVKDVADYLPSLWELCLKARDDIKETVRKAADVACRALHKVTVRACESPSVGGKVISDVLPLMLNKGMQNPSSEVQKISLQTILKMSQNAGSLLKPHIPVLVTTLLESLSSLEMQELNTLSLRLSEETEVLEKLDTIRVKASRHSPMMETIELCLPHIDVDVLTGLVPRLVDILKSGVGLGTKAAAAQLVISLVQSCRTDLTPYAGKLLTALTSGLHDRSVGVRKSSAQAIGHLVKVAKINTFNKFLDKMNKWYLEKNDAQAQSSVSLVFHAISRHSSDAASSVMADFIPLVFLAMHATSNDEDPTSKTVVKRWEETWSEMVPGEESTVRLYLPQLIAVSNTALQSQFWPIKSQGASALATVTEKMGSYLPHDQLAIILTTLLAGLQGRTWDGKEALLKALQKVCNHMKLASLRAEATTSSPLPPPSTITTALLAQCHKKQNTVYQTIAIETLGAVVTTLEVDVVQSFSEIAFPILIPKANGEQKDREEDERGAGDEERREGVSQKLLLREKTADAVGKTWASTSQNTQLKLFSDTLATLSSSLSLYPWRVQLALSSSLRVLFTQYSGDKVSESDMDVLSDTTIPALCNCLGNVKYSGLRKSVVQTLDKITATLSNTFQLQFLPHSTIAALKEELATVKDPQNTTIVNTVLQRLDSIM